MSQESANVFLEKFASDAKLRSEALGSVQAGAAGVELSAEHLAELGLREGFAFTPDEIIEAHAQRAGQSSQELADGDLDNVTGGAGKIKYNEFNITKLTDAASPRLNETI